MEKAVRRYGFENDEHAAIRTAMGAFARQHIAPHALDWEEAGEFPRALYGAAAEAGLLGAYYPTELGGAGGSLSHLLVGAEAVILEGKSVCTCVGLGSHTIALPPIVHFGTDEQRARYVMPTIAGAKVAALAITEPGGGSDVAGLKTRALDDGDAFVVSGQKTFITSGCRADFVVAAVRTGGEGAGGISLLIIDADTPGYRVGRSLKKMGWWASDTAELFFEDVRVPKANLLGTLNCGFVPIMTNFAAERLMLGGQCVAIATLAYEETRRYASERHAFGRVLNGFQVTRHRLAEMATRIAAVRAFVSEAVRAHEGGTLGGAGAAMVKNSATDMCVAVCDAAVQLHGGYGYMREYVVERLYRDARLYPIGGGTREIMNEIIAKVEGPPRP
ncbi:MAG: acyl-CoA dehydrogenase family protein [Myxococcota bacterium]